MIIYVALKMVYDGWVDPHVDSTDSSPDGPRDGPGRGRFRYHRRAFERPAAGGGCRRSHQRPIRLPCCGTAGWALPPARAAALRRLVDPGNGSLIDQALVLRFDAPNSATGENIVEYQCHGGRATVDALITALLAEPGVRLAEPGEFTRRALANGRIDLTEAEGLADLLMAETELQRRSAMARAGGALRRRIDGWRERLLALSAQVEVAIDYADEEDGASRMDFAALLAQLAADMAELTQAPRVEPLRDGLRVVVAGPPNAGKSSLVNALAQSEKAIVTHIAGTTRDVIEVPIAIGGVPFVLVDTAGLRDSDDVVETIGIDRARIEVENADILLWLGEPEEAPDHQAPGSTGGQVGSGGLRRWLARLRGDRTWARASRPNLA